jgi:hypothetical protein
VVLIKASRGMAFERVIEELRTLAEPASPKRQPG